MIKHPENCGINHGSRCSCGMSEEAGENDGFKFKDIPPLEIIKVEEDGTMTIDKFVVETIVEHRCEKLTTECDRLKEELETARDGNVHQKKQKRKWKSIADRLAEAVGHTSIGCCECCRKEPCKACQRVLDLVSEHKAIKSYNAVKGE